VYVPEALAIGEGPDTWQAYFNQQMRWAYGCVDILRYHTRKLTKTMPTSWRWLYISLQQGYFSGLAGFTGIVLLAAFFFGGLQISRMDLIDLIIWGAPLYLARTAIMFWMQQFSVRPKVERGFHVAGRLMAIAVWPIYFLAVVGIIRQRPLAFKVTPKGSGSQNTVGPLTLFRPHLVLALISLACVVVGFLQPVTSPVLLGWAIVNTVALGGFVLVAADSSHSARQLAKRRQVVTARIADSRTPPGPAPMPRRSRGTAGDRTHGVLARDGLA
jgi:cellulose synthase (UDP-forming)